MRKVKITIEEVGDGGYHIFCNGTLEGVSVRMLVDTGASKTVISTRLREQLPQLEKFESDDTRTAGIGPEHLEADFVVLKELEVGGVTINDLVAGVIVLDHVEEMYGGLGLKPFSLILGSDFLYRTKAVIDYRKKELRMAKPRG